MDASKIKTIKQVTSWYSYRFNIEPDELFNEVFSGRCYRCQDPSKIWFYARNDCLNYIRKEYTYRTRFLSEPFPVDPVAKSESSTSDELMAAISQLPLRSQVILYLRYWHGKTLDEISKICELDKGTISRNHKNAILKLKKELSNVDTD